MPARRTIRIAVTAGAVALFGLSTASLTYAATSTSAPAAVRACVSSKGLLSLLSSKGACVKGSRAVSIDELGRAGATGKTGATGKMGQQGLMGNPGTPGQMGDKGDKGDKGDTGQTGQTGPAGPGTVLSYADSANSYDDVPDEASLEGIVDEFGFNCSGQAGGATSLTITERLKSFDAFDAAETVDTSTGGSAPVITTKFVGDTVSDFSNEQTLVSVQASSTANSYQVASVTITLQDTTGVDKPATITAYLTSDNRSGQALCSVSGNIVQAAS